MHSAPGLLKHPIAGHAWVSNLLTATTVCTPRRNLFKGETRSGFSAAGAKKCVAVLPWMQLPRPGVNHRGGVTCASTAALSQAAASSSARPWHAASPSEHLRGKLCPSFLPGIASLGAASFLLPGSAQHTLTQRRSCCRHAAPLWSPPKPTGVNGTLWSQPKALQDHVPKDEQDSC